jgi:hypothetical protein
MNQFEIIQKQIQESRDPQSQVILYKGEAYSFFDEGLTRYVFANLDKTKVIKILIDTDSIDYNLQEFEIYDSASDEKKELLAETKMGDDSYIIEQEFCNPIKFDERYLTFPQIEFADRCRNEVGWNSKGKLVCFDLDEFKKY